ncbi:MAG: hypothetical protein D3926_10580 [Desulfobacteraceae bacterium]|nr:MAG: hypothetical protein D3926_10580 [Desulfobacteraceae bacterium]
MGINTRASRAKTSRTAITIIFLVSAALVTATLFSCAARSKGFTETGWFRTVEATETHDLYARNRDGSRYFNPWLRMPEKRFMDIIMWRFFGPARFTEKEQNHLPEIIPDTAQRIEAFKGDFILWIGHNTFLVRIQNTWWLTDPILTKRALLPARKTPPALTIEELNRLAAPLNIIISHNHYDHLDRETMETLPRNAAVYAPMGLKQTILDMNKTRVIEMDWWDKAHSGGDSTLICLPAQHWSMRVSQKRNQTLWASFLLQTPNYTLYFGGDSGYFKGFREFGKKFPAIDYAFLATTAYYPRWFMHYQHMNIPEAVKGFEELGARYFIPTQWGTFHLGDEPVGVPALELEAYIRENNLDSKRFKILDIGQILPITPNTKEEAYEYTATLPRI